MNLIESMKLIESSSYSKPRGNCKRTRDGRTELESVNSYAFEGELFVEAVEGFRSLGRDAESGDSVGVVLSYSEKLSRFILH